MNETIYNQLFNRLEDLWAIRTKQVAEQIWMYESPVLSDCVKAIIDIQWYTFWFDYQYTLSKDWNLSKPLLSEQSDELGEYLLTLLG